ncbi:hypothetical protein CEQ31_026235 [Serratia odorifera]|nr:hypothetical protein CEQ31_026235 [Serratia odorifera]
MLRENAVTAQIPVEIATLILDKIRFQQYVQPALGVYGVSYDVAYNARGPLQLSLESNDMLDWFTDSDSNPPWSGLMLAAGHASPGPRRGAASNSTAPGQVRLCSSSMGAVTGSTSLPPLTSRSNPTCRPGPTRGT